MMEQWLEYECKTPTLSAPGLRTLRVWSWRDARMHDQRMRQSIEVMNSYIPAFSTDPETFS